MAAKLRLVLLPTICLPYQITSREGVLLSGYLDQETELIRSALSRGMLVCTPKKLNELDLRFGGRAQELVKDGVVVVNSQCRGGPGTGGVTLVKTLDEAVAMARTGGVGDLVVMGDREFLIQAATLPENCSRIILCTRILDQPSTGLELDPIHLVKIMEHTRRRDVPVYKPCFVYEDRVCNGIPLAIQVWVSCLDRPRHLAFWDSIVAPALFNVVEGRVVEMPPGAGRGGRRSLPCNGLPGGVEIDGMEFHDAVGMVKSAIEGCGPNPPDQAELDRLCKRLHLAYLNSEAEELGLDEKLVIERGRDQLRREDLRDSHCFLSACLVVARGLPSAKWDTLREGEGGWMIPLNILHPSFSRDARIVSELGGWVSYLPRIYCGTVVKVFV